MRADIAGYSSKGPLVLIVEVKSISALRDGWAQEYRRNLTAHSMLPDGVYFMMVTSRETYLWKPSPPHEERRPDYQLPTSKLLDPYFKYSSSSSASSTEYGLEIATLSWLSDLTAQQLPLDHALSTPIGESGLPKALAAGSLRTEVEV